MLFKLWFQTRDQGDGSVYTQFYQTKEEAEAAEVAEGEQWGESSVDNLPLKIEDGKLYYQTFNNEDKFVWMEVKEEV